MSLLKIGAPSHPGAKLVGLNAISESLCMSGSAALTIAVNAATTRWNRLCDQLGLNRERGIARRFAVREKPVSPTRFQIFGAGSS